MRGPKVTYKPEDVVIWLTQDEVNHIVVIDAEAGTLDQERLESCWPDTDRTRQLLNMVADVMNRHAQEYKEMLVVVNEMKQLVEEDYHE